MPGLRVELADIDDPRTDRSANHRKLDRLPGFIVCERHRSGDHIVAVHRSTSIAKPAGACLMQCKNKRVERTWQTRVSTRRSGRIGDSSKALLAPQDLHYDEDARRSERTGQSGTQRLGNRAEFGSLLIGKGANFVVQSLWS